jgi:hypothetical protein
LNKYSSIIQWCGRFGNNIQQISNAIYFCEKNRLNFVSPENDMIHSFNINFDQYYCPPHYYFFHVDSITNQGPAHFICDLENIRLNRRRICLNYIKENLKINNTNVKKIDDNTIIIHVRGGDIFSRSNYYCPVVSRYIQNPLKYYLDIIEKFENVIILTEDYLNPVVSELEKLDNVEVSICSIRETIEILLSARNVATSGVSSFPIACLLLSENIENIYCSDLHLDEIISYKDFFDDKVNIHITNIDLKSYINYNEWLNNENQIKLMIEYI